MEFIILTDQPFSIVEAQSFQNLIGFSNISAKLIGRNTVRECIDTMFEEERKNIFNLILVMSYINLLRHYSD